MRAWQGYCLIEASVSNVLADFIRPGQTAFDVGTFTGGLTIAMSRLVGPTGRVVGFEANPETASRAADNLVVNAAFNAFIVNRAVETISGKRVQFYLRNGVGDSMFDAGGDGARRITTQTICLGEFIEAYGLAPDFLKFDIEGAELLALRGMENYIKQKKPIIILEQITEDFNCVYFMKSLGYIVTDLHNYKVLNSIADYPTDTVSVRNVVCLHRDTLEQRPELGSYAAPRVEKIKDFTADELAWHPNAAMFPKITLPPGRYILDARVTPNEPELSIYNGVVDETNAFIAHYHAVSGFFAQGRTEMPFHLEEAMTVQPAIGAAGDHAIRRAISDARMSLLRVDGFGPRPLARMVLGR